MCPTTQIIQSSSKPHMLLSFYQCLSFRSKLQRRRCKIEVVRCKKQRPQDTLTPSRHLHFLILSYSIVANSGLANSLGRLSGCLCMQIPSQGYVFCVSPLLWPDRGQLRDADRLVTDWTRHQTYFDVSREYLF